MLHADALEAANDAVSKVWEAVRSGEQSADDFGAFWTLVTAQLYRERTLHRPSRKQVSLDDDLSSGEGSATRHDAGFFGITRATQIDTVMAHEVARGIALLPEQSRSVMTRIALGESALDISKELRIGVHTVFRIIKNARIALYGYDLIDMSMDT